VATFYLSNPQGRAEGLPEVPEEFLADLQKRLIFGKIIEVRSLGTRAKVALGSKDGVKVQDVLRLQGADRVAGLRVVAVEDESCLVDALEPGSYDDLLKPGGTVLFDRPKRP
jgi:hypothetical protein